MCSWTKEPNVNLIAINSCECKYRVIKCQFDPPRSLFRWNKGDPFDTSIILWTRAVPLPASDGELPSASIPVCVSYKIGTDQNLAGQPVNTGEVFTTYDVDFTVKVEATGLKADTQYFYQFADCTNAKTVSPIGVTRTLSSPNSESFVFPGRNRWAWYFVLKHLRRKSTTANLWHSPFSHAPISQPVNSIFCNGVEDVLWDQSGWFNAYGFAARNATPDVFVHLGDYVNDV
jgi:alkaline phosphatase D